MAVTNTFWFKSKRGDTGLTDVLITVKNDGAVVQVTDQSMTHAAYGNYFYIFSTNTSDTYIAQMSSESERTTQSDRAVLSVITTTSTTQTQYATTKQVFDFLKWTLQIPNYPKVTELETVDDSGTLVSGNKIYLNNAHVIDNTFTLSFGASVSSVTPLTEDTHYTMDLTKSEATITAAGAAVILTASVFGEYKYNTFCDDVDVSVMIDRVSKQIEKETDRQFGSIRQISQEEHIGKGRYARLYHGVNFGILLGKTQLSTAVPNTTATTFTVDSTTNFTADDTVTIEGEQVTVDSVDSTTQLTVTRGVNGSSAANHSVDKWLANVGIQISNTRRGGDPTFRTKKYRNDFDVDSDTGAVQLLHINPTERDELATELFPPWGTFNRLRMSYTIGTSTVPDDLIKATILKVSSDLTRSAIAKGITEGRDSFNPLAQKELEDEFNKVMSQYRRLAIDGF